MIISILSQKGGCGKTTLSVNLARAFTIENYKTLLVDSDKQASARDWHARAEGELLNVIGIDVDTINKDLLKIQKQYDYIFVDGSPRVDTMIARTILASDLTLIPVQPSPYDLWSIENTIDIIKQQIDLRHGTYKAAFVINNAKPNTTIGKELRDALNEYELPVMNTCIYNRVWFAKSASEGKTIFEGGKKGDDFARAEILNLKTEIGGLTNELT